MIYGKINEIMNDLSKIENNIKWGWNSYKDDMKTNLMRKY